MTKTSQRKKHEQTQDSGIWIARHLEVLCAVSHSGKASIRANLLQQFRFRTSISQQCQCMNHAESYEVIVDRVHQGSVICPLAEQHQMHGRQS